MKSKQVQEFKETEIGKIPADWEVKKMEMLFHISAGGDLSKISFSKTKSSEYKYPVYSNSLNNKGLYGFSKEYQYEHECVTITARGDVGRAEVRKEPFSAVVRLLVLKPSQKLSCYFISSFINTKLNFSHVGSAQNQLTAPMISERLVAFPPTDEQEKISKVLSDLDTKISNLQNQNHTLEQTAQAIFQSWFVDFDGVTEWDDSELGKIPKGWKIKRIEELVNHQKGFVFKSADYQTHGIRIIRISDLTKDSINLQDCVFIDEKKVQEQKHQSVILNENDILITTVGSNLNHPESAVGRPIRVPTFAVDSLLNQNMVRLRSINPDLQLFLLKNIQHAKFIDYLSARTQGSANQASITLGVIFDYPILLPNNDDLLKNFFLLSESIYQKINKNQIQIISLTKTRDALLPKLMSGEIRV